MLRFHKKKFSSAIFDKKNDEKNDKKENEQKSWELTVWISVIQVRTDQGLVVKIRCPMRSW